MRIFPLFLVLLSLLACHDGNSQQAAPSGDVATGTNADVEQLLTQSMQQVEPTKYHESMDQNTGMVQARFPVPQSWRINGPTDAIFAEGPEGLKVHKVESQQYVWSADPMMQQSIQMAGTHQLAQPITIRQILDNYVRPNAESQGYTFIEASEAPEVAGFWQRLYHAMPNTGTQRQVEALATEWDTRDGKQALTLLVRTQFTNNQLVIWTVMTTRLEANDGYFDRAKNAYLYSYANGQLNPAWIQRMNGQLASNIRENERQFAEQSARSAAAHRQRMAAIAASGNAARSAGETYSDILDISHQGYLTRSNINDAGHSRTVNAISQTTLLGNHETGEHYDVPSGANFYWVSNQGTYFGTDNPLFDPNTDQRTNDTDWTKFAVER